MMAWIQLHNEGGWLTQNSFLCVKYTDLFDIISSRTNFSNLTNNLFLI